MYENERDSGTVRPNKGHSQTVAAQHHAEATVLLAGLMPIFLQSSALCYVNMSAGYPWHGAALSSVGRYKFLLKAMSVLGQLVGF